MRARTATARRDQQGVDLVLDELREEAGRFVRHPLGEMKRLEQVAEEGYSPTTPLLVALAVIATVAIITAVVIALALGFYYAR